MTKPGGFTAGDVLTAADMNGLPAGFIGSASLGSQVTGIGTSASDVSGLSVTFTAVASRRYKLSLYALATPQTSAGQVSVWIADASNNVVAYALRRESAESAGQQRSGVGFTVVTPSAGSVTYKVRAQREDSNTTNINAGSLLLVEDIGPA